DHHGGGSRVSGPSVNCAIYGRVSTDDQVQKFGLTSQDTECTDAANKRTYTIVAKFLDDGYSGATLDRPGLAKLRALVRTGAVDVVLIHAPDRLSRKLSHQ